MRSRHHLSPVLDHRAGAPLVGRKSVLMGMAASLGVVVTNAAQASSAAAGTIKPSPIVTTQPAYALRWAPLTSYALGQQVITPKNDVVSAQYAHTSSAAYSTDARKWMLSFSYARVITPTGGDDRAALQAAVNAGDVVIQGALKLSGSVVMVSDRTVSASGCGSLQWTGGDSVGYFFDGSSADRVVVQGLTFIGKSNLQGIYRSVARNHIDILDNVANCCIFSADATSGLAYSAIKAANRGHHVRVNRNRAVGSNKAVGVAAILFAYTDDWEAIGNSLENFNHGIQWWGGDSNFAADGALANERKCARGSTSGNKITNMAGGGIWGSMGIELVIGPDEVSNCGDVGVDLEGCFDVSVRVGVVKNCSNGNLATFFGNRNVVFAGGTSIQTDSSRPHFQSYNSSADGTMNPSVTYENIAFRTTAGIGSASNLGGPVDLFTVRSCTFFNTKLNLGFGNGHVMHIEGNVLTFTGVASAAFNAIELGATNGKGATKKIHDNRIYTDSNQPAGSTGIVARDSDYNGSPRIYLQRNEIHDGFPVSAAMTWAGTNAGTRGIYFARDNTLARLKVLSAGAGKTALVFVRDNMTENGVAVTVATV